MEKMEKEKKGQKEKIEEMEKEKKDQEAKMEKMEKEKKDQKEKMEKIRKEKIEKLEKEKNDQKEKNEKLEKEKNDQKEKIEKMEKEKSDQEEKIEKIKQAKKKVEEKRNTEAEKAKKAFQEEAKKAKSEFNAALAAKDSTITQQETQIAGLEGRITTLNEEVDGRRESAIADRETIADHEKQIRTVKGLVDQQVSDAEKAESKTKELSDQELRCQPEELQEKDANELAATRSELAAARTELDTENAARLDAQWKTNDEKEGDEEAKHDDHEDADYSALGSQRGSGGLPYNRHKIRSNKRPDGSIYTAKHPRSTPLERQGGSEQRPVDEQGAPNGQQYPDTQPVIAQGEPLLQVSTPVPNQQANHQHEAQSSNSSQVRRICPYFKHGACKFGARCFNSHDLSSSSDNLSDQIEEPVLQCPTPDPVQQSDDHHESRSSNQKPAKPICIFFRRGNCRFGAKCRDSHDLSVGLRNPRGPPVGTRNPLLGDEGPLPGSEGGSTGKPTGPRGGRRGAANGFRAGFWDGRGGQRRRIA